MPEIFAFFSNARDLECIRPPGLRVEIHSEEAPMAEGLLIDYAVTLRGVPFRWRSRIREWDPPAGFIDEQVAGPFSYWSHRHIFTEEADGSVLMEDIVAYRLPAWPFGEIAAPWVHRELGRIFEHRREKIREIFGADGESVFP